MKRNKFLLLAFAVAAMLTSCGGKQGGKMGDNEFAVRTIETQTANLGLLILHLSRASRTWRSARKFQDS